MDDEKKREEAVEDLDVPADEAEDVKGELNLANDKIKGEWKLNAGDGSVIKLSPTQFQQKF